MRTPTCCGGGWTASSPSTGRADSPPRTTWRRWSRARRGSAPAVRSGRTSPAGWIARPPTWTRPVSAGSGGAGTRRCARPRWRTKRRGCWRSTGTRRCGSGKGSTQGRAIALQPRPAETYLTAEQALRLEVEGLLYEEAALLDAWQLKEWLLL